MNVPLQYGKISQRISSWTLRRISGLSVAGLLALPALLLGCAINAVPHPPYLRAAETRGRVFLGNQVVTSDLPFKNLDPDHAAYYLVRPDQLARVRGSRALTYLGTQDHFHFLRTWTKVVDSPDEVLFVALDLSDCVVEEPRTFDDERRYHGDKHRSVAIDGGACHVPRQLP